MGNNKYNNNMTSEDFEFIKTNYQNMTVKEIAQILNKNKSTIYKAIQSLGLIYTNREGRPWTKEEIDYLKNNYLVKTSKEISYDLNRTVSSIQGKVYLLGLRKADNCSNWTNEEIEILKQYVNVESYEEISKRLNRSTYSIYNKVWELHLIDDEFKGFIKLKKEQILFIQENYLKMTDSELAKKFKVSIGSIERIRKLYGLKKTGNEIKGPTYIECFVKDVLDELHINYKFNENLGKYKPDFYIEHLNLIIEVNGDYFHCNPYLYPNGPKDEIQIRHIVHDYYKRCFYLSNGYTLLEIWEKDINDNPEMIKEKIKTAVYG